MVCSPPEQGARLLLSSSSTQVPRPGAMSVLTRYHAVAVPTDNPLPRICKIKGPLNFTPRSRRKGDSADISPEDFRSP